MEAEGQTPSESVEAVQAGDIFPESVEGGNISEGALAESATGVDATSPWPAPTGDGIATPERGRVSTLAIVGAVLGVILTATVWLLVARGGMGGEENTFEIDPSNEAEVLDGISEAELYVLDVDNIETHIHVQLDISIDGEKIVIPQVGVDMDTYTAAPIHTHSEDGILHVETDIFHPKAPTLLDFIKLWLGRDSTTHPCYTLTEEPCQTIILRAGETFNPEDELQDGDVVEILVERQ